ncbi:MAG: winged helix-turn-helix transcriptional regulator [Candidatus Helarchaeota archaeon]
MTETKNSLLLDPRLWNFFEQLITGKITEILPKYDSGSITGFRYPEVERLFEMDSTETIEMLNTLFNAGILEREIYDMMFKCPDCDSIHVHLHQVCKACQGSKVKSIEIFEHLLCGYMGPREELRNKGSKKFCPKCETELKERGVDYELAHAVYCEACGKITPMSNYLFLCLNCQKIVRIEELEQEPIFIYKLNMDMRGDLVKILSYRPILPREIPSRKRKKKKDSLDIRILNIMQMDARTSYREIARRTGVSDATIRDRVNKMIEKGYIEGFITIVNPTKVGKNMTCLINLKIEPSEFTNVLSQLKQIKEIKMIYELTEKNNIIMLVILEDKEELRSFINDTLYQIPGIEVNKVDNIINIAKNDPRLYL